LFTISFLYPVDDEEEDSIFTKESSSPAVLSKVCDGVKTQILLDIVTRKLLIDIQFKW
jgi:hypothetical protein